MRSVVVHLKNASRSAVIEWLDAFAISQAETASPWLILKAGDPVLYIELFDEFSEEGAADRKRLLAVLGRSPSVRVLANVSGRHEGTSEIKALVVGLLGEFEGVATDEFSDHMWTIAEIERGLNTEGMRFFDFQKAYDSVP